MYQLAKLLVRIISIYTFTKAIIAIGNVVALIIPQSGRIETQSIDLSQNFILVYVMNFLVLMVLAIILWILTDKIVSLIIEKDVQDSINLNIGYEQLMLIAFTVMGILIITNSIQLLLTQLANFFLVKMDGLDLYSRLLMVIRFFDPFIRIGIGLFMIGLGRKHNKLYTRAHESE